MILKKIIKLTVIFRAGMENRDLGINEPQSPGTPQRQEVSRQEVRETDDFTTKYSPDRGASSLCKCPELFFKNTRKYSMGVVHISQNSRESQFQSNCNKHTCDKANSVGGQTLCTLREDRAQSRARGRAHPAIWLWCSDSFFPEGSLSIPETDGFSPEHVCSLRKGIANISTPVPPGGAVHQRKTALPQRKPLKAPLPLRLHS